MKMKPIKGTAKANIIVSNLVFCILLVFIYSCGGGGGDGGNSSGTGSVSFGLALQDSGTMRALNNRQQDDNNGPINCQTHEIATIEAQVVDENEELLAEGGPWDCEDGEGTINDVEAGDNRKAKISAKDSDGATIFTGESEPFAVVAGEVTDLGLITLLPVNVAPLPPAGVTATAGIGQISLNWLPVADATTYNVYFSTSTGVSKTNFEGVFPGIVQTSFNHANLTGGDSFFYVVTAQNDIGESDESTEVSATVLNTPLPPPLPPTDVTATPEIGQISLNWLPVADATTYNVYFSTSTGVSKTNFEGVFPGIVQTSFNHANLTGGDSFFYVVTAQNDIGESDESTEVSATVLNTPLPPPLPPTDVTATPEIGQISLNWLPVADATTYNVYFSTSTGVSKTNFEGVFPGVVQTSFDHANLTGGDSFFYVVTTQNNIGEGGESAEVSATVLSVNSRLVDEFIGTGFGSDPWTGLFNAGFDGLEPGGGSYNDLATSDGILLENATLTYQLVSDGSLTSTLSDGTVSEGMLNPGNNILAVVDTDFPTDDFIEMDVGIKKSTGLTNADLNGVYIGVRISSFGTTALTTTNFDGNGNGSLGSAVFTYTVNPEDGGVNPDDGSVSISFPNNIDALRGVVSSDGNIVSLVDTSGNDDDIDMSVLIRTGSGLSNATLSGDYVAVSFGVDLNGVLETARTSIISDGVIDMQFDTLSSSSGILDTFSATYSVAENGGLTINLPNEETLVGIVDRNGDIFTFVNTNPNAPLMGVAIRKTQ